MCSVHKKSRRPPPCSCPPAPVPQPGAAPARPRPPPPTPPTPPCPTFRPTAARILMSRRRRARCDSHAPPQSLGFKTTKLRIASKQQMITAFSHNNLPWVKRSSAPRIGSNIVAQVSSLACRVHMRRPRAPPLRSLLPVATAAAAAGTAPEDTAPAGTILAAEWAGWTRLEVSRGSRVCACQSPGWHCTRGSTPPCHPAPQILPSR